MSIRTFQSEANYKQTGRVVNATNAPARSQSFKIFSKFKGDNSQKSLDQQFQPNKSKRMEV
jgi:hypothetical protein